MKAKKIKIQVEECKGGERVYKAIVAKAQKQGFDRLGEPIVSLKFKVYQRSGEAVFLTKFYFGPFTKVSALLRDVKKIVGPAVAEASVFDLGLAVDKRCRVKVSPGESYPQLHVLDHNEPTR